MSKRLTKEQVIDMLDDDGYEVHCVMEPGSDEELEFSDIEEAMDDMEQEPNYSDAVDQIEVLLP